jgi:hypothetical protein
MWMSVWDFISAHKDQIIQLAAQVGMLEVLSKVIGEYSIVVMLLPGLFSSDSDTRYATGVQIGVFGGKALLSSLKVGLEWMARPATQAAIAGSSDTIVEGASLATAEVAERTATEAAAASLAEVLGVALDFLNPVFDIVGFLMIVGMVLDMMDPCGLNNTLSKDDITSIQRSFDSALFTAMMKNVGTYPVEWYAENIQEYNLVCPTSSSTSTSVGRLSKATKNYLTRPENIFGGTAPNDTNDCATTELALRLQYTKQYQNSLTTNSLGQCVRPMSNSELEAKCSDILGVPVTLPTGSDVAKTGLFGQFQKAIDYASLILADDNVIVANFLSTYWYVVAIALIVILLISFFL